MAADYDKSAAIFYCYVAAWFPDLFCNFYLMKLHKNTDNSATSEASKKISTDLESLEFKENFDVCLNKF
jgi:hypothetical protein